MKKILLVLALMILIAMAFRIATFHRFNSSGKNDIKTEIKSDPQNTTYLINGQRITLVNGISQLEAAPNSASKIITKYFGDESIGDLNGDGVADKAFYLTQETGGSGIFYYISAAIANGTDNIGLNAILLGDRIAPQTTEIQNETIIANYADRKSSEPMTVAPSIGVSRYFKVVNNNLEEVKN